MRIGHNIPKILGKTSDFTAAHQTKYQTILRLLEDGIQGPKNANLALYFTETRGKALISPHFIEVAEYVSLT